MASQDARLSKFEADFKQQQNEMTNKINTVLKAITDRIAGALPSDTVKNPKLNVDSTTSVLSARSYPMEDPNAHPKSTARSIPSQYVPSNQTNLKMTNRKEKIEKKGATRKTSTPPHPHHMIHRFHLSRKRKNDDSREEGPEGEGSATIEGLEVEYFDTFPNMSELEYHRLYLTRRSLEVLRKVHWMTLGERFNQLSHVSSPLLSKPGEY
ncbi:hypothetical protein Tco_0485408 [Tanacetum coccineum]